MADDQTDATPEPDENSTTVTVETPAPDPEPPEAPPVTVIDAGGSDDAPDGDAEADQARDMTLGSLAAQVAETRTLVESTAGAAADAVSDLDTKISTLTARVDSLFTHEQDEQAAGVDEGIPLVDPAPTPTETSRAEDDAADPGAGPAEGSVPDESPRRVHGFFRHFGR